MPSVTLIRYFYPNVAGWPRSLGSHEVTTQRVSPVILKIMGANILVSRPRPVKVTWRFLSRDHLIPQVPFPIVAIVTESLSPTIFEIMGIFYIWVTTLTFLGDVTSSVTWPFDSPGAISSYRCSIVNEFLSNHFRDIGYFLCLGHDLDLSRSRAVIGHVTNRSAICHFLLVSHCNRTSISNRFRDIRPPKPVRTHTETHPETRRKWFYILSHAMYCIRQTKISHKL